MSREINEKDRREQVVVMGASPKPERYANKALHMLGEYGHEVLPVHPAHEIIAGHQVYPDLKRTPPGADTLTLYLSPRLSEPLADDIVDYRPGRVIMNPGTESPLLKEALENAGIPWQEACTLVLLRTNQF